jgi:hypothetical protein
MYNNVPHGESAFKQGCLSCGGVVQWHKLILRDTNQSMVHSGHIGLKRKHKLCQFINNLKYVIFSRLRSCSCYCQPTHTYLKN